MTPPQVRVPVPVLTSTERPARLPSGRKARTPLTAPTPMQFMASGVFSIFGTAMVDADTPEQAAEKFNRGDIAEAPHFDDPRPFEYDAITVYDPDADIDVDPARTFDAKEDAVAAMRDLNAGLPRHVELTYRVERFAGEFVTARRPVYE